MALLSDVITAVTESQYWTRLTAAFDSAPPPVPWRSWSVRNPYLAVSKFLTLALSETRALVAYLASGMYLDTGEGAALELFVKSQYQLVPTGPVFAKGRFLIKGVPGAPAYTFPAGSVIAGTPGPFTAASRLYTNSEAGSITPGGQLIMEFTAQVTGDAYNIPSNSQLELKTSYAGLAVTNPPSGAATPIGYGDAAVVFYAKIVGVTVALVNHGSSLPLVVTADVFTKLVTIQLRTDGAAAVLSTAEEVRAAVKFAILIDAMGLSIGQLLLDCKSGGTGLGIVAVTTTPAPLDFAGTWLSQAGAPAQTSDILKTMAASRWDTLGGGAGDGAPESDAGTADALVYYGLKTPAGYPASPVRRIRSYSNLDPDTGLVSGGVIAVYIAGPGGALSAADVAAVEANYYNPRKFSWGSRLAVRSATNLVIYIAGTVNVRLSSKRTLAGVQAAVEAALVDYAQGKIAADGTVIEEGFNMGMTVYPEDDLASRIRLADRTGIRDVVLTQPAATVVATYSQIPVLDTSGLVYVFV